MTAGQLVGAIADNRVDVIQLTPGTYAIGAVNVDIERTRPVVIRPQQPGSVVFAGNGSPHAFSLGAGGRASNIAFEGLVFDGYFIGERGLFTLSNAHNISMTGITIRNTRGVSGNLSWALYLSSSGGSGPTNVRADYWTIYGAPGKTLGGFQSMHDPNAIGASVRHWQVFDLTFALYAASDATGLVFDDWTITRSGASHDGGFYSVVAVAGATLSNMRAIDSGGYYIYPPATRGPGLSP